MSRYLFTLYSIKDTEKFGKAIGVNAAPGDVICLDGDLGAGKTTLSQAIARGLQVAADCYVTSPSFAVLHEYPGRIPMYHMDFYRLSDSTEAIDLGFEEYFYLSGLTVIEWSGRAEDILPADRLKLYIEIGENECRRITCSFSDEGWKEKIENILLESELQYHVQDV